VVHRRVEFNEGCLRRSLNSGHVHLTFGLSLGIPDIRDEWVKLSYSNSFRSLTVIHWTLCIYNAWCDAWSLEHCINTAALLWLSFDLEMLGLVFKSLCMVYEKGSTWTENVELCSKWHFMDGGEKTDYAPCLKNAADFLVV
jgi:hypothetical protein